MRDELCLTVRDFMKSLEDMDCQSLRRSKAVVAVDTETDSLEAVTRKPDRCVAGNSRLNEACYIPLAPCRSEQ